MWVEYFLFIPKLHIQVTIGNRKGLSDIDAIQMRRLYSCPGNVVRYDMLTWWNPLVSRDKKVAFLTEI